MPSKPMTDAQRHWHGGRHDDGGPTSPRPVEAPGTCGTSGCGLLAETVDESDPALDGWVLICVLGSREPARWYCSGPCAHYGIALAQVRPAEDDQEPKAEPEQRRVFDRVRFMPRGRLTHLAVSVTSPGGPVEAVCGKTSRTHTACSDRPLCPTCQKKAGQGAPR